ncbi:glycosyltransferase [Arenibacterium sp. LLYu02]|uniref:glycosyltransferase n=1 Tax=Arenibacterium sp. LLYu02 TaxID=3404132 RepID=UPI003B2168B1
MSRFSFHYERLTSDSATAAVFQDPRRIRARRLRAMLVLLLLGAALWIYLFFNGAFSWQTAYEELRTYWQGNSHANRTISAAQDHLSDVQLAAFAATPVSAPSCEEPTTPLLAAMAAPATLPIYAHLPMSYDWGSLSLDDSCGTIGVVMPEWMRLEARPDSYVLETEGSDTRAAVDEFRLKGPQATQLLPTLTMDPGQDRAAFFAMLSAQAPRVLGDLVGQLAEITAQGACLEIEGLRDEDLPQIAPFLASLKTGFHAEGLQTCVVLSGTESQWLDQPTMDHFDKVVLKLFSEPWVGTAPAPLAPDAWFAETAKQALAALGRDKLVVALGSFAVEWTSGTPLPSTLPFAKAMEQIAAHQAELRYSEKTSGSFAAYQDQLGRTHKIWLQDAASLINQRKMLSDLGIDRIALWSLGQEDPGVWTVLRSPDLAPEALSGALAVVQFDNYIDYSGEGAFLRVAARQSPGIRQVRIDAESGRVTAQRYDLMPRPYRMERYGKPEGRQIVLTFDDGPDGVYTAEILDTLKETQTPATFFVTGKSVMDAPEMLERIIAEGHVIGAHTFSHPRMDLVSKTRMDLEFSLLDKIVAGAVGRKPVLYREPFQRSGGPISADRMPPLEAAQARGLQIAGMDIVPRDWEGWDAEKITQFIVSEVEGGGGNVVLLHDGGLHREASVAAVPMIIKALRDRGYSFVSMADLINSSRGDLMPVAEGGHQTFDRVSFSFVSGTKSFMVTLFWVTLAIGVIRSLAILILSLLNWRGRRAVTLTTPRVAVIIPAHNEEKVIRSCIESVRASDYANFEIIVVDDGSTDKTITEVLKFSHQQNIRLISQPNQGKWSALNRALLDVKADIVVCIDADTQIQRSAISHLVKHFNDPKVGAVAGKIIVGNKVNLLSRLQSYEYATSQNMDRMAFDLINGMMVVPGALGAWRVAALKKAGLYSDSTLTEDADLTIQVNRAGYRVTYEPRARAYTEVPEQIGQLLKQRLRWSFGMFQAAWKHKRALFEGRMVGLVTIPDMFIFGYLFPLLAPIADLFVIVLLWKLALGGWSGEVGTSLGTQPTHFLWAYLTLPVLELLIAAVALARDEDESLWSLWLYPVQRVFYRPVLYYSVFRAILRAITGRLASWGALSRQGRDYSVATGRT